MFKMPTLQMLDGMESTCWGLFTKFYCRWGKLNFICTLQSQGTSSSGGWVCKILHLVSVSCSFLVTIICGYLTVRTASCLAWQEWKVAAEGALPARAIPQPSARRVAEGIPSPGNRAPPWEQGWPKAGLECDTVDWGLDPWDPWPCRQLLYKAILLGTKGKSVPVKQL